MKKTFISFLFIALIASCTATKKTVAPPPPKDASPVAEKKSKEKSYSDIITNKATTDDGLFKVHKVEDKFYYEIPANLLGKDILWITRISQIPTDLSPYINAGSKTNEQVVRWELKDKQILLKSISFNNVAGDTLPIAISVNNNNLQPIIASFKVELSATDSTGILIQVNDIFEDDIPAFSGLSPNLRKQYKVSKLDKSRSFIDKISSFPTNIEAKHTMTFVASEPPSNSRSQSITMQMNQSMILLPEEKMVSRLNDYRVGWFTTSKIDYSSEELKSDKKTYLRKWKLVPKDKAAYLRGELVEPEKPIVYYLDPATPDKFKPYFKQGIEDWQVAFEKAGFKNAIIAKYAPTPEEDPDFSPEDARYSVVRYVASTTRNAVGPSVSDPRTGEIIESDIIWYHNHLRSYRNRYLIETGAANPVARTLDIPTEEIGEMMRRVICHEVGHALGLPHNMKASSAYPTDSLRSGAFTQKYGIATTIMDYARFNYVAQPGDEGIRFVRQLGPYDEYSIEFGYRWYPNVNKPEDEKSKLDAFVSAHSENPLYQFGGGYPDFDPASQTESVGDNAMKASSYGINNLKIVASNLVNWTSKNGEDYEDLEEIYGELLGIWNRYLGHVAPNLGGVNETRRVHGQGGDIVYTPVAMNTQREAMAWMINNAFTTPNWLIQPSITQKITYAGTTDKIIGIQNRQLGSLLDLDRLKRLSENEFINANQATYTLSQAMSDLNKGIWSDVYAKDKSDVMKRALQRNHLSKLGDLIKSPKATNSDIPASSRASLLGIKAKLVKVSKKDTNYNHYLDCISRIELILEED
ncbi:protein of unknown function [Spirosomataceae bacterium TFI 002]|nr:protein of unknown function [Spirosomataceae bacterium TFI 002]